jgi:hypothetical protein
MVRQLLIVVFYVPIWKVPSLYTVTTFTYQIYFKQLVHALFSKNFHCFGLFLD